MSGTETSSGFESEAKASLTSHRLTTAALITELATQIHHSR